MGDRQGCVCDGAGGGRVNKRASKFVYNVGVGEDVTIRELAQTVMNVEV